MHYFFPSPQCTTFLNPTKDKDATIFRFPYYIYSSLYMALAHLQSDKEKEGDLFFQKKNSFFLVDYSSVLFFV